MAKHDVSDEVSALIRGCSEHGHSPSGFRVTLSKFRELINETLMPPLTHAPHLGECANEDCQRWRKALRSRPGDEGNMIYGLPVTIVPDPPPPIQALHDFNEGPH